MSLTAGVMGVTPPEQSELWIYMTAHSSSNRMQMKSNTDEPERHCDGS